MSGDRRLAVLVAAGDGSFCDYIETCGSETIASFKESIKRHDGCDYQGPISGIQLKLDEVELHDNRLVRECNVNEESFVTMTVTSTVADEDEVPSSAWTNVVNPKGKKSAQHKFSQSAVLSTSHNDGVRSFLSTFKTSLCSKLEFHDHRKCKYYHSDKDKRRDPYTVMYLPEDEDILSTAELVYHPMNYLTRRCDQPFNCPYGRYCARAHEQSLVRSAKNARLEYNEHLSNMALERNMHSKQSLGNYAPALQEGLASTAPFSQRSAGWNVVDHNLPKCSEYLFELPLDSKAWFLINSSNKFFSFLREIAMKEGLAQIEIRNNHWGEGEYGIAVRGSKDARERAVNELAIHLIEPPPDFFVQRSKSLGSRVVKMLGEKTQSEINDTILERFASHAYVEVSGEQITICASNQSYRGEQIINQVFEKLSFWIKQEGLDQFVDCDCCCDSFNLDQGIACRKGHFYCSGENGCIGLMVKEQLKRMHNQDDVIVCSICQEMIDTRSLAPHLTNETWLALQETMIDSKVKLRVEKLSHDFDKRLDAKIQEFMNEYGSLSGIVKHKAKQLAKQAQDDIMNLKCPNCKAPYAEFDGCMAIQCGSCNQHFCGYCHGGPFTGGGAHAHVRQCLVNETNNGSYYATPEQVKVAQRKHRTRMLKKFLQTLKKDVQNATVLELEEDLKFHGIEKAALFEFGNLQREIEN